MISEVIQKQHFAKKLLLQSKLSTQEQVTNQYLVDKVALCECVRVTEGCHLASTVM